MNVNELGLIIPLIVAIFVGLDAKKRQMNYIGWGIGVFFLLIIFLPLYFFMRKPKVDGAVSSNNDIIDAPMIKTKIQEGIKDLGEQISELGKKSQRSAQQNITGDNNSPTSSTTLPNQNEKIYYVNIDDEQLGPYDLKKIRSLIQLNKINSDTLIWKDGMKEWDNSKNINEINKLLY